MRKIAWGTSKLFWLYLQHSGDRDWQYVIDDFTDRTDFEGIPVRRSAELRNEKIGNYGLYIFAVSNDSICAILAKLAGYGLELGRGVHLYSDLFSESFAAIVKSSLGWKVDRNLLSFAVSATLNSRKAVHTTICGSWLFLESLRNLKNVAGDIAEVGCFEGGNALLSLQSPVWHHDRRYVLFDSFEGFPELSPHDPTTNRPGDYATKKLFGEIVAPFSVYREVDIIKGFVPGTFARIPADRRFSLVFYDCDLYQPALDTFAFFWDRLERDGLILIHDYFAQPGGFHGVRDATIEFFRPQGVEIIPFWHTTMAAVRKS